MNGIALFLTVLTWFWVFWLLYPTLMNLLACWRSPWKPLSAAGRASDLGCIITAYRNLDIALPLVESLLHQQHPRFRVYLVADACPTAGNHWYAALHDPRFTLLRPEQPLGSKVRSLQYARERFLRAHEAVVVFDPDNLAPPDFLRKIDEVLRSGFWAAQGRRAAKNTDSTVAAADATGELYKNFIEREVPTRLGSSATIAGSGMAVKTSVWDAYMASSRIAGPLSRSEVIPAEDKILQNYLVGQGLRIPFRWDAVLYDEKVETDAQVQRQRTRWLFAYFQNVPYAAAITAMGLLRLDRNPLIFGLYALVPPLVTLVGVAGLLAVLNLFLLPALSLVLLASLVLFTLNLLWTLYLADAPAAVWKRLYGLPRFAWNQALSMLGLGRASKDFLVTEKRRAMSLDEVEGERPRT